MEQTEFSHSTIFSRLTFNRFLLLPLHYPILMIVIVATITTLFGWHLPKLHFRTAINDLVVADLPATTRYTAFRNHFGSDEIIRVVIRSQHVFDPKTFDQLTQFSQAIEKINGIRRIISLPKIKKTVDLSNTWSLDKFEAIIAPVALFEKDLISTDGKATVMTLILKNDADKEHIIESVEALIDRVPKDLTVYQIGMPLVSQAMARYTEKDFKRLPLITLLLITLILSILFRCRIGLIPPLTSIIVTLIWTFGLMGWMQIPLSMMTMIVPVFWKRKSVGLPREFCR